MNMSLTPRDRIVTEIEVLKGARRDLLELMNESSRSDDGGDYSNMQAELTTIDTQIGNLGRRLTALDNGPAKSDAPKDQVDHGRTAICEDEDGNEIRYTIVQAELADANRNMISSASPIGRALMGQTVGNSVTIRRPRGDFELVITGVEC